MDMIRFRMPVLGNSLA